MVCENVIEKTMIEVMTSQLITRSNLFILQTVTQFYAKIIRKIIITGVTPCFHSHHAKVGFRFRYICLDNAKYIAP